MAARVVPTGLAIAIPPGYGGFVLPRSGLALHHGITCLNTPGLIDPQYRGELKVLLVNTDPDRARTPSAAATASPSSSSSRSRRWSGSRSTSSTPRRATRSASAPPAVSARARVTAMTATAPVPIRRADVGPRRRAGLARACPDRSRRSATRRCSCPITSSARSSRRWSRSRSRRRSPTRSASACSCWATTTSIPAVVAKEAATLDLLSEGRLEFGLGAGWMTADYTALDLPYDSHRTRIERLGEAIEVVKRCWADGPFDFEGEHYTIRAYDALPKPVQQPRPPILVGGGGKRVLTLAGKEADIVGINPNLSAGEVNADVARTHARRGHDAEDRLGARRSGRPLRRDRAADPLLHGRDHRRRSWVRRSARPELRHRSRRRARGRQRVGRHGRRGLRHARARDAKRGVCRTS